MHKLIFIFLLITPLLFAQTWKNTIDLDISANSNERIGLYTNNEGNHVIVQTATQINYYLYNSGGIIQKSSTIDSHSETKRLSLITGSEENVYVIYKKGFEIKSKRSTNGGDSWTTLAAIPMTYSDSDGMDAATLGDYTHLTWSEKQGSTENYETNYMKIHHNNSSWQDFKQVTDETGIKGGIPSVTLASNHVTIGFTDLLYSPYGFVYSREIINGSWQTTNLFSGYLSVKSVFINDDSKSHAFIFELGDCAGLCKPIWIKHYMADLGSNTWVYESSIHVYDDLDYISEGDLLNGISTDNNLLYIACLGEYYSYWNGTVFNYLYGLGNGGGENIKISATGNDVFAVWIDPQDETIYLRQKDFDPLKLENFDDSWSNNHPKVTWDESEAADFKEYVVEKSTDGINFSPCTTIVNIEENYYVDTDEFKYSPGYDRDFVWYRVKQYDLQFNVSSPTHGIRFTVSAPQQNVATLDFSQDLKLNKFQLSENYPNPFNPETKISFGLPEQSSVSLIVYNIQGKQVTRLAEGSKESGFYTATFNAADLTSGVYIYRFTAKGLESGKSHNEIKRMLLIK